jgi:hypothetical protein
LGITAAGWLAVLNIMVPQLQSYQKKAPIDFLNECKKFEFRLLFFLSSSFVTGLILFFKKFFLYGIDSSWSLSIISSILVAIFLLGNLYFVLPRIHQKIIEQIQNQNPAPTFGKHLVLLRVSLVFVIILVTLVSAAQHYPYIVRIEWVPFKILTMFGIFFLLQLIIIQGKVGPLVRLSTTLIFSFITSFGVLLLLTLH